MRIAILFSCNSANFGTQMNALAEIVHDYDYEVGYKGLFDKPKKLGGSRPKVTK